MGLILAVGEGPVSRCVHRPRGQGGPRGGRHESSLAQAGTERNQGNCRGGGFGASLRPPVRVNGGDQGRTRKAPLAGAYSGNAIRPGATGIPSEDLHSLALAATRSHRRRAERAQRDAPLPTSLAATRLQPSYNWSRHRRTVTPSVLMPYGFDRKVTPEFVWPSAFKISSL